MVEYSKVTVKWTGSELEKLKPAVKNNTGATSRISLKMFNGNDKKQTKTRQKTKLRNAFNNNMQTDNFLKLKFLK